MEQQLKRIVIAGTVFLIDAVSEELREWHNANNRILFHDLKDEGEYFTMAYDRNTKNIVRELVEVQKHTAALKMITLPKQAVLQPQTVDKGLMVKMNSLSHERDWGIWLVDEHLAKRL